MFLRFQLAAILWVSVCLYFECILVFEAQNQTSNEICKGSSPESGLGFMIASSAKTFEQQPPKIRLSMTDTARKEGIVSMKKVIMRFRGGEDWSEHSFSCALLGGLVAFVFVEVVLVGRIGSGAPFDCASVLSLGSIVSTVVVLCRLVALEEVISCAPLIL